MNYKNITKNLIFNILILLSFISIFGSIVYRFYALNSLGIIITLILSFILLIIVLKYIKIENDDEFKYKIFFKFKDIILLIVYLLFFFACFYILIKKKTDGPIVSPWQIIPYYFFIFYIFSLIALATSIILKNTFSLLMIIFHYFLSFSVALIIYKIGYGFDPFIHQATINLIDKFGYVYPKPFYYLGQYSLELIINFITFLPLNIIDRVLVPLMSAIFLPIIIYKTFKNIFQNKTIILLTILLLLMIPFSLFVITTPQNLAFLYLILVIILGIGKFSYLKFILMSSLSLAALSIQPISGIPAVFFTIYYIIDKYNLKFKKIIKLIIFIITSISLPTLFYFFENNNFVLTADFSMLEIFKNINSFIAQLNIPGKSDFILNFIYLYFYNFILLFILLVSTGLLIIFLKKDKKIKNIYFIFFISMLLSYTILTNIPFNYLIDYERNNYNYRILINASLFLIPYLFYGLYNIILKIFEQKNIFKISSIFLFILFIAASLYITYPRFDKYYNSHSYSTSKFDIKAVNWIKNNSKNNDYIVLANQQVSAAALKEFGFAKYYHNDIFYYPIPTGGKLYNFYLKMSEEGKRKYIIEAMKLVGVKEGYFVINSYWWNFRKIIDEAKVSSDGWEKINNGEVYIFKYIIK